MTNKKSEDARAQLHIWSKLLEGRIALQKVVVAVRDLEKLETDDSNSKPDESNPVEEATTKSVVKLLSCLVRLRDKYRCTSQFSLDNEQSTNSVGDENAELYANIDDSFLDQRHEDYNKVRSDIIEKWYEKTKISTIPKKGYTAMELPTLQLIQNALRDKERLVRRTQLDRTNHLDDSFNPETFNDDDFYHQLLKEIVSKEDNSRWIEMQRLRYKNKRKADTKATKGRKIKKDLIPKLVNFMAPSRPANISRESLIEEDFRHTLIRSLFGGIAQPSAISE